MAASSSLSIQEAEIEELKSSFEGKVKIISNIGDFSNVVTIQPADQNIQLKLQLTDEYPASPPLVSVMSPSLSNDQLFALTTRLSKEVFTQPDKPVIKDLLSACKAWLIEQNIDTTIDIVAQEEHARKTTRKPKGKLGGRGKAKVTAEESLLPGKKPPMKTASDVIKRIQWDTALDKNNFVVGYLDRMEGVLERPFVEFTWVDLSSLDNYCLAVPQHRIQYFKYKDEKVWDKNERLDNVFSSTGSGLTIIQSMARYEAMLELHNEDEDKSQTHPETTSPKTTEEATNPSETDERGNEEHVSTEYTEPVSEAKKMGSANVASGCRDDSHSLKESSTACRKKHKFNYFVALEITNKRITEKLKKAQVEIAYRFPQYWPYIIPENGFHLTLTVMSLDTADDHQRCVRAMKKAERDVEALAKQSGPISFVGLDHWGTRVVFAKVRYTPQLLEIVDLVKNAFTEEELNIENSMFKPHLTLFKVGRVKRWDRVALRLEQYEHVDFGRQEIDNVQVCAMGSLPDLNKGETGFYSNMYKFDITK